MRPVYINGHGICNKLFSAKIPGWTIYQKGRQQKESALSTLVVNNALRYYK